MDNAGGSLRCRKCFTSTELEIARISRGSACRVLRGRACCETACTHWSEMAGLESAKMSQSNYSPTIFYATCSMAIATNGDPQLLSCN
jgi:hypothetical protein